MLVLASIPQPREGGQGSRGPDSCFFGICLSFKCYWRRNLLPCSPLHAAPSFICNDFLNSDISLFFTDIGLSAVMSMLPFRRNPGTEIILKCSMQNEQFTSQGLRENHQHMQHTHTHTHTPQVLYQLIPLFFLQLQLPHPKFPNFKLSEEQKSF